MLPFQMPSLAGEMVDLAQYHGHVLVIVNVASACGYTPQYRGLQTLYTTYAAAGLYVLGFPCNQFGHQEPGTATEIATFCERRYGVTFPMFAKVEVNGPRQCALYHYLTAPETNPKTSGPIGWNFEKFVLGRDGTVVARFDSAIEPLAKPLVEVVTRELAKPVSP